MKRTPTSGAGQHAHKYAHLGHIKGRLACSQALQQVGSTARAVVLRQDGTHTLGVLAVGWLAQHVLDRIA